MNQANQNLLHPSRQVGADLAAWRKVGGGEGLLLRLPIHKALFPNCKMPIFAVWAVQVSRLGANGRPPLPPKAKMATIRVCNANEDEPGTFKDRVLLANTPHQVIEAS